MKVLLGIFKRWVCLIPAIIIWILSHPINVMLFLIPEFLYWFLTGRSLMKDGALFIEWTLT